MGEAPLYLLDTNVLVAYVRAGPIGEYVEQTHHLREPGFKPLICVVSVGEIFSLAKTWRWGEKKIKAVEGILGELVLVDINVPEIWEAYAEIDFFSRSKGRSMGKNDVWIAAATKVTSATLLTTDKDFDHLADSHISRVLINHEVHGPGNTQSS